MKKLLSFIILLLIFANVDAGVKKYFFERISIQDGLSQSTIYDILQDKNGFIWFCTDNGLNRYDGIQFKKYFAYNDSLNSLSSNRIFCGAADSYGYLWFGTEVGLNKFDPQTTIFNKYFAEKKEGDISNNTIRFIFEDKDSLLWVGTNSGLNKYSRENNTFVNLLFDKPHGRVNYIIEGKDDSTLWIGTSYYGLYELNKFNNSYKLYKPNISYNLIDNENNINSMKWVDERFIYLGTDAGLIIFDSEKKTFVDVKNILIERQSFSSDRITDFELMPDSSIWISTWKDGIIILDKNKKPAGNLKQDSRNNGSISNNRILKIFTDRQNIVWLGTYSGGINKYDRTTQKFELFNSETEGPFKLLSDEVWQVFEDSNNRLWICSEDGLSVYNKSGELIKYFSTANSGLSNNNVFTITEDSKGKYWIGTLNGLNKYDFDKNEFLKFYAGTTQQSLSSSTVTFLYADKQNLWIGTAAGLNRLDLLTDKINRFEDKPLSRGLKSDFITSIIEDHTGESLWIGTLLGLNKFNKKTSTSVTFTNDPLNNQSISSDKIYGLLEDSFKNIWICTLGGGLNKYIPEQNVFVRYRESEGLSNDLVYGIVEDNNNVLWMSTNYGITRFNPLKNEFTIYDVTNGLQSNEFNFNSYAQSKDGKIFFGGVNGINSFYPDKIFKNELMPETKITSFKIFNKEISPVNSSILKKDITYTNEIILDHNENIFTIEFSSLNFSSPGKNQYQYIIEGLSKDWISTGNRNFASFSNIAPGNYLFKVRGSNNDNVWDEKGASLYIIIKPPVWKSWWAIVIYFILLSVIIFSFVYIKFSLQKREIAALQKTDKLKSEFLAQMSHEIRTPINVILSFAGLLKEEIAGKISEDLNMGFKSIGNAGKRIIRTIDLILNMSEIQSGTYDYNPEVINIHDDIILKLLIEFRKVAENKGLKLEVAGNCSDCIIYADSYTVEQIFANLIDNAIKFTEKGFIKINIIVHKSHVIAEVIDTGKGIKQEYFNDVFSPFSQEEQGYTRRFEGNGLGLSLVKKYCEINNAVIDLESEYGKGTKFIVVFNKHNTVYS
ncbi:MAG: hypothetical protein KJ571_10860 [Bacteroidetes bacterium]|nr:hypothetical protein [Bacteroidota bacterium]